MGTSDTATLRIRAEQRAILRALQDRIEPEGETEPKEAAPRIETKE